MTAPSSAVLLPHKGGRGTIIQIKACALSRCFFLSSQCCLLEEGCCFVYLLPRPLDFFLLPTKSPSSSVFQPPRGAFLKSISLLVRDCFFRGLLSSSSSSSPSSSSSITFLRCTNILERKIHAERDFVLPDGPASRRCWPACGGEPSFSMTSFCRRSPHRHPCASMDPH